MLKKISLCITVALVIILEEGCAGDNKEGSYHSTSARSRAYDTSETRAARMRKALSETSRGQEVHREYVEKRLKMLQHERDESGDGEIITDIERAEIESRIRIWEEETIEDFASKNCYLENIQSRLHPIAKETANLDTLLIIQEYFYKEGKINEEEIRKARKKVRLQKEEYGARQRLADLLISANNYG